MTDAEILDVLKNINYACLFVMLGSQRTKFGPGELLWQRALSTATGEQRDVLVAKIERWQKRSIA